MTQIDRTFDCDWKAFVDMAFPGKGVVLCCEKGEKESRNQPEWVPGSREWE